MYKFLLLTMKNKNLLIALMMILIPMTGLGQIYQRPVNLLIHAGLHGNWLNPDEIIPAGGRTRLGLSAGLRMDYNFHQHFSFSWGAGFVQAGGNVIYADGLFVDLDDRLDSLPRGSQVTYRTSMLEIPLAMKLQTNRIGYTRYFVEAGLDPLIRLKSTIDVDYEDLKNEPFTEGIPVFNLAYHAAVGLRYSFTRLLGFQVSLFYKNTFLDFTKEHAKQPADNIRLNQAGISLALTFL
ncbi:MAG: PorT family protein [Bacteroidales bacterium]|nr:PorT family protein [Bacteroidales bacterium]